MNIYCFPYIFAFNIDPFHCISFHFLFNRFSTKKWTYVLFSFICKESKPNNATCLRSFGTTFVQFTKKKNVWSVHFKFGSLCYYHLGIVFTSNKYDSLYFYFQKWIVIHNCIELTGLKSTRSRLKQFIDRSKLSGI